MDNQEPQCTLERYYEEMQPGLEYNQPGLEVPQPGLENSGRGPEIATDPELQLQNASEKAKNNGVKVFGLKRKTFTIVTILAICCVITIIGGVVGGTLGTRKKLKAKPQLNQNPSTASDPVLPISTNSSTPSSTTSVIPTLSTLSIPSPTSAFNNTISKSTLLENSTIASVNWTDINDIQYHGIFHQNKTNSILLSLWDSKSRKWSISPVSIAGNKQLEPILPGTSIAAMVPRTDPCTSNSTQARSFAVTFQLSVYFYSTKNNIMEFYTTDPQAGTWQVGSLTQKRLNGNPDSQLAAAWQRCCASEPWCLNNVAIMYQHPSQKLKAIGFTTGKGWSENSVDVSENVVAPGTGMAMIPLADKGTGKVPSLLKGYVESNQVTQEFSWEWGSWRTGTTFDDPREDILQLAAIPLYTTEVGLSDIYVAKLHSDGSISSKWCENQRWEDLYVPNMDILLFNFTAIAMNYDRRAYGVSLGQIYEYEISNGDPTSWTYIGTVDV